MFMVIELIMAYDESHYRRYKCMVKIRLFDHFWIDDMLLLVDEDNTGDVTGKNKVEHHKI